MNAPIAEALPARQSRFNRFMTRWLASPLGFLSGGVCWCDTRAACPACSDSCL
jgi:hypothetical protein